MRAHLARRFTLVTILTISTLSSWAHASEGSNDELEAPIPKCVSIAATTHVIDCSKESYLPGALAALGTSLGVAATTAITLELIRRGVVSVWVPLLTFPLSMASSALLMWIAGQSLKTVAVSAVAPLSVFVFTGVVGVAVFTGFVVASGAVFLPVRPSEIPKIGVLSSLAALGISMIVLSGGLTFAAEKNRLEMIARERMLLSNLSE